jgi:tetratricopeptide (TPR) repeat protein
MQFVRVVTPKISPFPLELAASALVFALIAGCAQLPQGGAAESTVDSAKASASIEGLSGSAAQDDPAPLVPLKKIIQLIEDGQAEEAQNALKTYLDKNPKNTVALSLQHQLTHNPDTYLGKPEINYTVQAGDTLGGIAAKFLGSPLKFVILGRYNHISRVKDLHVGQVLKLPANHKADPAAPAESAAVAEPEVTSEQPADSTPRSESVAAPVLAQSALKPERKAPAATKTELGTPAVVPSPNPATDNLGSNQLTRVQQYHEAALVAYRKQNLDAAIALWNKALAIDPTYEPALGYRARAQELQRRLNQLGAH